VAVADYEFAFSRSCDEMIVREFISTYSGRGQSWGSSQSFG